MKFKPVSLQPAFFFLLLTFVFSFDRCSDKCQVKSKFVYYAPVYSTTAEIKAAAGMRVARDVKNLGKIYVKDAFLFVNEAGEGIHIFDNHDPAIPQPIGFLNIPGNLDLAIQGTTLYADSYIDLVAFDISDIHNIKEVNRIEGLFSAYSMYGFSVDPQKGIVTSFEIQNTVSVMQSECEAQVQPWGGIYYDAGVAMLPASGAPSPKTMTVVPSGTPGVGGSTARFAIVNHFLYGLDGSHLHVVDISSETNPLAGKSIDVAWDAETLFPHGSNLFVGARAGMYIFDLTTPDQPQLLSQYDHILSCDPVAVEGDYAYVTLYSGGLCHVDTNQLEVIDIKDLKSPQLVSVYPMTNPHGVGIDNGTLFICDGDAGLRIFDASDPLTITQHSLAHYDSISALDVIPINQVAMMIGSDGIFQYDYSDVKNIRLLSQIPIGKQ
jgi:hypothetical protein